MVYADYDYYQSQFFGTAIPNEAFPRLALRASAYLDYCTMGRAKSHADLDAVKMACCALAEQYQVMDAAQSSLVSGMKKAGSGEAEVQSESVGSWSRTYKTSSESASSLAAASAAAQEQLSAIARQYLGSTGLLRARGYYA